MADKVVPMVERLEAGENVTYIGISTSAAVTTAMLGTEENCVEGTIVYEFLRCIFDVPTPIAVRLSVLAFDERGLFTKAADNEGSAAMKSVAVVGVGELKPPAHPNSQRPFSCLQMEYHNVDDAINAVRNVGKSLFRADSKPVCSVAYLFTLHQSPWDAAASFSCSPWCLTRVCVKQVVSKRRQLPC
jgi:hypothetical protein